MLPVPVSRSAARFVPDPTRTITKPFSPGDVDSALGRQRVERLLARILGLAEADVVTTLRTTEERFSGRHPDLRAVFEASFARVARFVGPAGELSLDRRLLIGAYFTHEYAIESAALSNPSMVPAPDQTGLAAGETRFVMSLRAIGEGHISSIQFRSGVIDATGHAELEPPTRYAITAKRRAPIYEKRTFRAKSAELHVRSEVVDAVVEPLAEHFTIDQLEAALRAAEGRFGVTSEAAQGMRTMHWLASSNYESSFPSESKLSERVLFPAAPTESHGMEDARFVRFTDEQGAVTYYATYTAYDGHQILPQLIETRDFSSFAMATLNGPSAKNKGIALFPRKIGGRFLALARVDNENNYLMGTDNVHFWHQNEKIQTPKRAWEFIQLGNCGSPLETEAGWLVITHGVGPMRQYALGAILLDKEDPARMVGNLSEPLLEAAGDERDGYVPNVVYSCGSMIANALLVLPYGFSDVGTRIATVRLDDLLTELTARS